MTEMCPHTQRPADDREGHLPFEPWTPWQWFVSFLLLGLAVAPLVYGAWRVHDEDRRLRSLVVEAEVQALRQARAEAVVEAERIERMRKFYAAEIEKQKRKK